MRVFPQICGQPAYTYLVFLTFSRAAIHVGREGHSPPVLAMLNTTRPKASVLTQFSQMLQTAAVTVNGALYLL